MSKLKLSSSATGTGNVTLKAPVTNSDYELVLPTITGDIVVEESTGVVLNQSGSTTKDVRIETGASQYAFFVDASEDGISIGGDITSVLSNAKLHIVSPTKSEIVLGQWTSVSGGEGGSGLFGQNCYVHYDGGITYKYQNSHGSIGAAGVLTGAPWSGGSLVATNTLGVKDAEITDFKESLRWTATELSINEGANNIDFRVESQNNTHCLFVNADQDCVNIGTTDTNLWNEVTGGQTGWYFPSGGSGSMAVSNATAMHFNRIGGDGTLLWFGREGGAVGTISVTSAGGTTYNTTSDRRLKDNIKTITDGTEKLMAMHAVTHTWKADPEAPAVHGFIAQEMQDVIPEAVTGEDGGEEMMSMDYGRITPVIVAALQDAIKEIEVLKSEIEKLKGSK